MSDDHVVHEKQQQQQQQQQQQHEQQVYRDAESKQGFVARIYSKSVTQMVIVALVLFSTSGMFNALGGIGGGGQVDPSVQDRGNIALYTTFAVVGFFAGTIHNVIGTKCTLFFGALGYSLYIASFLSYNHNRNNGFVTAAGTILGLCAGLIWTGQGAMMLALPTEAEKGTFISIFWVIFNLGAVLGSAIELGLTYHLTDQGSLPDGPYIAFLCITLFGAFVAFLLKDPGSIRRSDGSRVVVPKSTHWTWELKGLVTVLRTDPLIVLLFPAFLASNWFYTWQFNDFNGVLFNLRTRALNSMLYWMSQMVGAFIIGLLLDNKHMSRKSRAWVGWGVVFAFVWAVMGGSYAKQVQYTRENKLPLVDLNDGSTYAGLCFLYIFMGILDSFWQCYIYYLMGTLSNDVAKLAHIAGFYKSIQSAGAASAFAMDFHKHPYMTNLAVTWALCAAGLLCALPVLQLRVTETTPAEWEKTVAGREEEVKAGMEEAWTGPHAATHVEHAAVDKKDSESDEAP